MSRGPLLFKDIDAPGLASLETYRKGGGYEASISFYGKTLGQVMVASAIRCAGKLKQ